MSNDTRLVLIVKNSAPAFVRRNDLEGKYPADEYFSISKEDMEKALKLISKES